MDGTLSAALPASTEISTRIEAIDRDQWNHCYADALEAWDFLRATEDANMPGFEWRYLTLHENGVMMAAAPVFITDYHLHANTEGTARRVMEAMGKVWPWLMCHRLISLGSPVTECCQIGFAPELAPERRAEIRRRIIDAFVALAKAEGIWLMALKDVHETDTGLMEAASAADFARMAGLPTAVLDLPANESTYLASLSSGMRKELRRKMKTFGGVRIEERHNIDDVLPRIRTLYEHTIATGPQFEHLPLEYFTGILRHLGDRATCCLYWAEDDLVGFNLLMHDDSRMLDNFLGMDPALSRRHNLYFLSWMHDLRMCFDRGIGTYQSGQGFYGLKVRLGSRLINNWMFFRHRWGPANWLLRRLVVWLGLDEPFTPDGDPS